MTSEDLETEDMATERSGAEAAAPRAANCCFLVFLFGVVPCVGAFLGYRKDELSMHAVVYGAVGLNLILILSWRFWVSVSEFLAIFLSSGNSLAPTHHNLLGIFTFFPCVLLLIVLWSMLFSSIPRSFSEVARDWLIGGISCAIILYLLVMAGAKVRW